MTKKDESPEEATNPYWSDELLAVLAEALGDEDRARQTLEGIIQQAQEGKAMRTLSTERLASHLTDRAFPRSHRPPRTGSSISDAGGGAPPGCPKGAPGAHGRPL